MLFVHDHTFVKDSGMHYTTGSLNNKVMSRYIEWFGSVDVFASTRDATEKDSMYIRKENLVNNVNFNLVKKKNNLIQIWRNCLKLKKYIMDAECVVARMSILGAVAVIYARKFSKPYLVEMVACPWDSLWYHSLKGKIFAPFMTILTKVIIKNSSNVLYVTNDFLQKRYPCSGNILGCSDVELLSIDEISLEKRLSKIRNFKQDTTLKLCTVANVGVRYKGQELVIKAISYMKKKGIYFEYYLIGGGDNKYLKNIAKKLGVEEHVHFEGAIAHEDVFEYLDNIDIYVQPSLQEGLPRAVIEAMSRACPVIGSNAGGIPELIDNDCIFKKRSYLELINILRNFDDDKMRRTAKNNFNRAKKYDKKYLDQRRNNFYNKFAKNIR